MVERAADLVLENLPRIENGLALSELIGLVLFVIFALIAVFHKYVRTRLRGRSEVP